jgi:DNA-binding transcriptional MerR regulator
MRTDQLIRRVEGLDRATLDALESTGFVTPDRLVGGNRWWGSDDLNRVRDILRLRRGGVSLEEAGRRAAEEEFFGLCPCDWREV